MTVKADITPLFSWHIVPNKGDLFPASCALSSEIPSAAPPRRRLLQWDWGDSCKEHEVLWDHLTPKSVENSNDRSLCFSPVTVYFAYVTWSPEPYTFIARGKTGCWQGQGIKYHRLQHSCIGLMLMPESDLGLFLCFPEVCSWCIIPYSTPSFADISEQHKPDRPYVLTILSALPTLSGALCFFPSWIY